LRGGGVYLDPTDTAAEVSSALYGAQVFGQDGITFGSSDGSAWNANTAVSRFFFSRRPGFFDEVCFTGTSTGNQTLNHNLTVVPELIITKARSIARSWYTYNATTGVNKFLRLDLANAAGSSTGIWPSVPNATTFTINVDNIGLADQTAVAYLFATCPGVSKVGSYTGTGATQTINCGFTGGARFVLIKRTDSTGNWWIWDTARGMVSGTDYRFPMNTTDAQSNNDWVLTASTGFQIVTTDASVNDSGGSYIYLAIA
jgi:hypothetical protein